jgi:hypothetical protein
VVRGFVKDDQRIEIPLRQSDEAAEIAKKQFPTMALEDLKATLDRSFATRCGARTDDQQGSLGDRQRGRA